MCNTGDVDGAVRGLSSAQLDVCMKYIYAGLESGENSGPLLKWHEAAFNAGGMGCIIRAMARPRGFLEKEGK